MPLTLSRFRRSFMDWLNWTLAIASGISILGSAGVVITKVISPARKLSRRVKELEDRALKNLEAIEDIQEMNRLLCKGLLSLLENTITGNNVEKAKKVRTEIQEYLIKK